MTSTENARADAMAAGIANYLRRRSGVSLVELSRDIDGFGGEDVWGSNETNVIIWDRVSQDAIAAMTRLIADETIIATPANVLVYAYDGCILDLPLATNIHKKYARRRWLPLVFAGGQRMAA